MSELNRYSRQILFEPIGPEGQERLLHSRVVILGLGALGTVSAELCARAGIGSLVLVDRDFVEESNLQRQILFDEQDAAEHLPKAIAAARKLRGINSKIKIRGLVLDANASNIEHLVRNSSLLIDGTDNFESRFLINDACVKLKVPWIYGAAVASEGAVMVILPGVTPCLRCLFEDLPPAGSAPTCETAGVIAPAVTVVASLQVAEAMKILVGQLDRVCRTFRSFDVWRNTFQEVDLNGARDGKGCVACGSGRFEFLEPQGVSRTHRLCGRNAIEVLPAQPMQLSLPDLEKKLSAAGAVQSNPYLVRCVLEEVTLNVFADGRAIVQGTHDPALARSLYAKYVGN
ncbi:MAG: ThiF family adenylyltransferase [Terriglobia bacterium]